MKNQNPAFKENMELPLSGNEIATFLKNCHLVPKASIFIKSAKENCHQCIRSHFFALLTKLPKILPLLLCHLMAVSFFFLAGRESRTAHTFDF
jgi:hypothetical protein